MALNRKTRSGLISWQRHHLTLPRLQMSFILLLTGLVGLLSSFVLLHCGLSLMWLRYPLAILAAYGVFLLLLRLWLAYQRSPGDFDLGVDINIPSNGSPGGGSSPGGDFSFGGGGDAGGGGAGGSWDDGVSSSSSDSGDSLPDGGFDFDVGELGLILLAAAALLGGLLAAVYVVYIAPVLLAEILVDGLLLSGLYRRIGNVPRKHWLQTVIRKTLVPALVCMVFFGVAGGTLQKLAPEAGSIVEVWRGIAARHNN